jgi:phosphoserine phosphatase RsbU/P
MNDQSRSKPVSLLAEFDSPELLDLLADGAYITDMERRIVFWNQAAQRITGWEKEEVVGHSCRDNILVHVDKDGHALCGDEHCPLHRSIVTGQPSLEALLVFAQHRAGHRIPVEVTVSPVRNHAGEVIGGIEVFRDLTESVRDQLRAKEIQEMAVNCVLPEDERVSFEMCYQPRDVVGGDFFRIEKLDDDHYGILVADAKGHGIAAALYTLLLRSLWEEHRSDLGSPGQFMGTLNTRLKAFVREEGFFGTAMYGSYDATRGQLRLVQAGHPAPLLFRADGTVAAVENRNPALGLFPTVSYVESNIQLESGDALLLYSDGATEVFDDQDHELGKIGLIQLVRDQGTVGGGKGFDLSHLESQLLQYSNQLHLADDLTLIKLRRLQ